MNKPGNFSDGVVDYLRRIGAIPSSFVFADEAEFLTDLYTVCSDRESTLWQKRSFLFDRYATENLDFEFLIVATSSVISSVSDLPESNLLAELENVADALLIRFAPGMPANLRKMTAEFVVRKSAFHSDMPSIRAPLDACAADWEDYPLPAFSWPWPELESELSVHANVLPEFLQSPSLTPFGNRDLTQWRKELREEPDSSWLEQCNIKVLRTFQKQYCLPPARTKKELSEAISSLTPVPADIRKIINENQRYYLNMINSEEELRARPLSESYKRHLVRLVQVRVDSYYLACYGYGCPETQWRNIREREYQEALKEYEGAKTIDLAEAQRELRLAFEAELGKSWEKRKAASKLFSKLVYDKRVRASASMEDLLEKQRDASANWLTPNERSRFIIHRTCDFCGGIEKEIDFTTTDDLPPFHLLCSCPSPSWVIDYLSMRPINSPSKPFLERAINEFVKANMDRSGISVRAPSLKDMVEFIEAAMKDEEEAMQIDPMNNNEQITSREEGRGMMSRIKSIFKLK